jgi:hypothetical protein
MLMPVEIQQGKKEEKNTMEKNYGMRKNIRRKTNASTPKTF